MKSGKSVTPKLPYKAFVIEFSAFLSSQEWPLLLSNWHNSAQGWKTDVCNLIYAQNTPIWFYDHDARIRNQTGMWEEGREAEPREIIIRTEWVSTLLALHHVGLGAHCLSVCCSWKEVYPNTCTHTSTFSFTPPKKGQLMDVPKADACNKPALYNICSNNIYITYPLEQSARSLEGPISVLFCVHLPESHSHGSEKRKRKSKTYLQSTSKGPSQGTCTQVALVL